MLQPVQSIVQCGIHAVSATISRLTRPIVPRPMLGTVTDRTRNKPHLVAENLLLRQQRILLNRSVKWPRLTPAERGLVVLLASTVQHWQNALLVVKPAPVLRWHRQGFRRFWKRTSRMRSHEPKIPAETITLIKEMAATNRVWGAERIRGELLQVGIKVAKRTVQRYMRHARPSRPHDQTCTTFICNHAQDIWACDFLQVQDVFFRALFAFFITELGSRRIVHVGVTHSPSDVWVAHQLREAPLGGAAPRYLIRDNDAKYGAHVTAVVVGSRTEVLCTPVKAPVRHRDVRAPARQRAPRMLGPRADPGRAAPPPRAHGVCPVLQSGTATSGDRPSRATACRQCRCDRSRETQRHRLPCARRPASRLLLGSVIKAEGVVAEADDECSHYNAWRESYPFRIFLSLPP